MVGNLSISCRLHNIAQARMFDGRQPLGGMSGLAILSECPHNKFQED
ncbi:hypothetical protein [Methylomonas albis]|nr:hypothetical protein [Methylomonas albis]